MIYAKTGMERMPERCADCDMEIGGTCFPKLVASERGNRPDWCPLTEIETENEKHAGNE